jgi:hypothetical protein
MRWTYDSMHTEGDEGELWLWTLEGFLIKEAPELFEADDLTDIVDGIDVPNGAKPRELVDSGLAVDTLVLLDGWNRQIRALQKTAQLAALNLYTVPTAIPHQLGVLSTINLKARAAYDEIGTKIQFLVDDKVGHAAFQCRPSPPLTAIAVTRCKGDLRVLPEVVMGMRHEYRGFRRYLTDYESAWNSARNRIERIQLKTDFDAALAKLIERGTRPHDRLFYKLWDVVKSPTRILQSLGDRLVAVGREEAIVGQVAGLSALWRSAIEAPLRAQAELCSSLSSAVAQDAVWHAYERFAKSTDHSLLAGDWKGQ